MKVQYPFCSLRGGASVWLVLCCAMAVLTFTMTGGAFAQVQNQPGIVPEGVVAGFAVEGDIYANSPLDSAIGGNNSDWFDNAVAGRIGIGVLNNDGTPKDSTAFGPGVLTVVNRFDLTNSNSDDSWVGGSKLNKPDTWGKILHNNNNKSEINHAYVMVTQDQATNDFWLTVGIDRESNNGTDFPGILVLQNGVSFPLNAPAVLTGPDGGLTNNDLAVILAWSQGGNQPTVRIFRWLTDDFVEISPDSVAATAFVSSNAGQAITSGRIHGIRR